MRRRAPLHPAAHTWGPELTVVRCQVRRVRKGWQLEEAETSLEVMCLLLESKLW